MPTNNEQRTTNKTGFTLIELMIAISIIAVISTIAFLSYSKAQELGRDGKRKQDLRSMAIALEIYKQKNGRYPLTPGQWQTSVPGGTWVTDSPSAPAKPLDNNYSNLLPLDPLNSGVHTYNYWSSDFDGCTAGNFYILVAYLENDQDPDRYYQNPFQVCNSPVYAGSCTGDICRAFIVSGGGL